MTRLLYFFLTITILLLGQNSNGQLAKDSAIYWVNDKYLACLDSGKSVCHCEEQNKFLILHIDAIENKLTIKPSIYYSWETFEIDIKLDKKNTFSIMPFYAIDTGSILNIKENKLILVSPQKKIVFTKIKVKRLDNWINGDLWRQIGVINCRPLLNYSIVPCKDAPNLILTKKELSNYIAQGQITISCSDDYHYNEMHINESETEFFLIYDSNSIRIYKILARTDRYQKVDIGNLKGCQLFYKP